MLDEMWRRMLRLKTIGEVGAAAARKTGNRALTGVLAAGLLMAGLLTAGTVQGRAQGTVAGQQTQTTVPIATSKIGPAAPVTYDN